MAKAKKRQLNPQWKRFVDEYLVDFNAQAAAGRAGFSLANTGAGTRLLYKPQIIDEIRRRCLEIQSRLEITGDDVRRAFAQIVWDPRQPSDGGPSFEARITANRELGKLLGLYTNKIQVTGSLTLVDLLLAADRKVVAEQPASQH